MAKPKVDPVSRVSQEATSSVLDSRMSAAFKKMR